MRADSGAYCVEQLARTGRAPYVIPAGGSSPVGVAAFVAAAFELAHQITAGELPEPDLIYVPMGTAGTAAGLVVGLRAAGLVTRVRAATVVDPDYMNGDKLCELANATAELLQSLDAGFPLVRITIGDFDADREYFGGAYAHITDEAREAIALGLSDESLPLEGTYTGKAFAAMIGHVRAGHLKGRTVLYWHTLNSVAHPAEALAGDYHNLPEPFHAYFTGTAQDE
jgi:D-cysteine desulfhydrase